METTKFQINLKITLNFDFLFDNGEKRVELFGIESKFL